MKDLLRDLWDDCRNVDRLLLDPRLEVRARGVLLLFGGTLLSFTVTSLVLMFVPPP
jgi:hypothetical protein